MTDFRNDPWGRSSLPVAHADRPTRVALLIKAADALVAGEPVPQDAAQLLGKALQEWLRAGGDLDRLLEIRGVPGSHTTVPTLVRRLSLQGVASSEEQSSETRRFEPSS